uniref:DUF4755 domain-containing protein n=1 Tax=Elaeophora elaphi TaxID=1147741 RepID=A0A0R3RVT2_9BILA
MTFVTFIIAVVAIGAFYFYSTKPACREAVNNWSASACEALQEKITQSSGQVIKQKVSFHNIAKVNTRNMMQSFLCPAETPVEVLPSGSTVSTVSTGSRLITGISGDEKPEDETHTGRAETALTNTAREKGLVT